jgi:hypothetical protein
LTECQAVASRYRDRRRLAEYHRLNGQLYAARGDHTAAHAEWETAGDLFIRMGMRREAQETQDSSRERDVSA